MLMDKIKMRDTYQRARIKKKGKFHEQENEMQVMSINNEIRKEMERKGREKEKENLGSKKRFNTTIIYFADNSIE